MKREINVGSEFCTYVKTPLVADDVNAYNVIWETGEKGAGAGLLINAKRSDGITVTDYTVIDGNGRGEYVLANNMYSVTGNLEVRLSVVCDTTTLTERLLIFEVIEGNGNDAIESESNVPLLTSVMAKASEAVAKAESVPDKLSGFENDCGFISEVIIPEKLSGFENDCGFISEVIVPEKLSEFENDCGFISEVVIPDKSITPEKTTFYGELEVLKNRVIGKTVLWEDEIVLTDKLEETNVKEIEICGNSFQNDSIITYSNKTVTSGNLEITCRLDGTMILNGILMANEEVTLQIPEITFYAGVTYKSALSVSDSTKSETFSVCAENFTEGEQSEDSVCGAIKIVQGNETGIYENFEFCYRIYEEERSGKNTYPVYCVKNPQLIVSGINLISYNDVSGNNYCTVENKGNGLLFEGRYYAGLSNSFISRLTPGKTYTFSCKRNYISGTPASNVPRISVIYEDGTATQWTYSQPTATLENKKITSANLFIASTSNVKCEVANMMFQEGDSASEYEEYVSGGVLKIVCGDLWKIGDVCDKVIIREKIYAQTYINKDAADLSADVGTQKNLITILPEETVLSEVSILDNFRNKTLKFKVTSDVTANNKITYYAK